MADNNISKNRTSGKEGKYSYKYTDIAQIHEYLEEKGISYYQYIETLNGVDYIMTVPIIKKVDKDGKETEVTLAPRRGCRVTEATLVGINNPAQQQGSAITYARRYSLLMAFGLATEDDDAQSLSTPKASNKISRDQVIDIEMELKEHNFDLNVVLQHYKVKKLEDLTDAQYEHLKGQFQKA